MELHFYHFYETILFFGDGAASVTIFIRFFRASAAWIYQSPSIGEFLDMMSHDEFVARYEKGDMGCSVSVLFALRLFLAGRIRERRIALNLLLWLSGLLLLIAASVLEFLKLAFVWALLCSAIGLVFYASVFFYSFGGLVLSAALADEDFYRPQWESERYGSTRTTKETCPNSTGNESNWTMLIYKICPIN